jgi:ABC-type multidrug transport system ATPase subunit
MEGTLSLFNAGTGVEQTPVELPRNAESATTIGVEKPVPFTVGSTLDCHLVIPASGAEPSRCVLTWHRRHCTWVLENQGAAMILVEGQPLGQGSKVPLLVWDATLRIDGNLLRFRRKPAPPKSKGKPVAELTVPPAGIIIGRGDANKDGSETPRLELDPEIISISSKQAEIKRSGGSFILVNHNSSTTGRTIVNGDQNFDEHKLVLGDCIQIPNCDYYTFKFTGDSLRHISSGGNLLGSKLTVDVPGLRILHPLDLEVPKGGFLGIIGGSGQGKSTLMNSLCGIVPATAGHVTVGGRVLKSPREVALAGIGYVPQDDIVHRELRVEDALRFAACLRLKASKQQIHDVLEATMDVLRLTEHRKKIISNLSGGQRKRVSIASELLTSPDFLFLDEPTSGLDPQTERNLMGELSILAQRKRMGIACTTHVLQNCHVMTRLAFISRGRLIFHGSPVEAVRFFLLSGTPDGAAMNRSSSSSASATAGGTSTSSSSTVTIGDSHHEFSEAELLSKISRVYDIAQDTTKPIAEQDKTAQDWEREYKASTFFRPPPVETASDEESKPRPPKRVGALRSLWLLVARQWKLLVSSKLNYLFLAAQSILIGLLIGWVDDDPVLQSFLALIATLWFGCSNGAQQIVAELAIFRRERLAGLGINTYLLSKFSFLTAITCVQAMVLYAMVIGSSHFFHSSQEKDLEQLDKDFTGIVPDKATREFRMAFFDKPVWSILAKGDDSHPEPNTAPAAVAAAAKPAEDDFLVSAEGRFAPSAMENTKLPPLYINPTGLKVTDGDYLLLEKLAWLFRVRENVLDTLKLHPVEVKTGQDLTLLKMENGSISWKTFVMNLIFLRFGSLLAAALVGVSLGLAVSSLVNTPTQAVMWVPLILIPQILFGSFVVIAPEMTNSVLAFSRALPSFNLQRIMDVAHLYGRETPRMTNQTKIPAFFTPPEQDEEVYWTGHPGQETKYTKYKKASDANKSWQNLIVNRDLLGQREKEMVGGDAEPAGMAGEINRQGQEKDTVESREDVITAKGTRYLDLSPARVCATVLGIWAASCYLVALISLRIRQTGR